MSRARLSAEDFRDLREDIATAHSAMGDMLHSSERESREHAVRAFNYMGAVVACLLDHVGACSADVSRCPCCGMTPGRDGACGDDTCQASA